MLGSDTFSWKSPKALRSEFLESLPLKDLRVLINIYILYISKEIRYVCIPVLFFFSGILDPTYLPPTFWGPCWVSDLAPLAARLQVIPEPWNRQHSIHALVVDGSAGLNRCHGKTCPRYYSAGTLNLVRGREKAGSWYGALNPKPWTLKPRRQRLQNHLDHHRIPPIVWSISFLKGLWSLSDQDARSPTASAQGLQNPLIKEHTLNHIKDPITI